ncbi:MAG: 30S ribosomal protein S17 [Alphaproteobacteria bacterium]|nr:30S ribosomal protein S17 [Alphaproteobacteria bacterium]
MPKRILQGTVVSDKGDKTIVVRVDRRVTHPVYKKIITRSKKFMAHDEENLYRVGDTVRIEESRPLSKRKRWLAIERIARGVASREDIVEAEAQAILAEAGVGEASDEGESAEGAPA